MSVRNDVTDYGDYMETYLVDKACDIRGCPVLLQIKSYHRFCMFRC